MNWKCNKTWKQAKTNTLWCLLGCSIGDFGTIFYFQKIDHSWSNYEVMVLAIVNGLLTSIILETIILLKQMDFYKAVKTALGMSFISMLMMEIAMEITDLLFTQGELGLMPLAIPFMLVVGFLTPWPYNYWRLKKYGQACH